MDLESIPISWLILYLPTCLFALFAIYGLIRGIMRGMKKSIVALVNMLISIGVCLLIVIFIDVDFILNVSGVLGDSGSLAEYINSMLDGTEFVVSSLSSEVLYAYANMFAKLTIFSLLMLLVYPLIKFFLFIIYLIFFKRRIRLYNEEHGKKPVIGGVVGLLRGSILGFLIFSQFSMLYCIVAGGMFYGDDQYTSIKDNGEVWQYDEYYKALKTSRSSGLGFIFDSLAGEDGTPFDYLLMDFVASGKYENYNGETIDVNLREELTSFTRIAAILIDNGFIVLDNGNFTYNIDAVDSAVIESICASLGDSTILTNGLPTILFDILNTSDLGISLEAMGDLDLKNDFNEIGSIIATALSLFDFSNGLSFEGFVWNELDVEIVDSLINSISRITLLTELMLPIGTEYLVTMLSESEDNLLQNLVFDFDSILWNEEIQNLRGLYDLIIKLDWDILLSDELDIFEDVLQNEELLLIVDDVVQKIFNSDLIFGVTTSVMQVGVEMLLSNMNFDGNFDFDLTNYTKENLQEDVSLLISSTIDGINLFDFIFEGDFEVSTIFELDVELFRKLLLGYKEDIYIYKGLFDLNILNCLDLNSIIQFSVEMALGDTIEIPNISDWKLEISSALDILSILQTSEIDFNAILEGDYSSLNNISSETADKLTEAISSSMLMSAVIVFGLSSLDVIAIPDNVIWYGEDGEIVNLLNSVFHLVELGVLDILLNDGDILSLLDVLSVDDFDVLLSSTIIHYNVSAMLVYACEEYGVVVIPDEAYDNNNYISKQEILNLVDVMFNLGIDFETFDISTVKLFSDDNIDLMTKSIIVSRTIVSLLDTSLDESFTIPDLGDNWYNENQELKNLLISIQALIGADSTLEDLGNYTIDIAEIINNADIILESCVFLIMFSNLLIDLDILEIPTVTLDLVYSTEVIKKAELISLLNSLSELGLTNLEDGFDISLFFGDDVVYEDILDSVILAATLSVQLEKTNMFVVPEGVKTDGYINTNELEAILNAVRSLGINDLTNFTFDIATIMSNLDIVFSSDILLITVSGMFNDVDLLSIPSSATTVLHGNDIIKKEELVVLFDVLLSLGLTDLDSFDVSLFFGENMDYEYILSSSILSATLSTLITSNNLFDVPSSVVDSEGYILTSELNALFTGLNALGFTDPSNAEFTVESLLKNEGSLDTALNSVILRNSISNEIFSANLVIVVEYDGAVVVEDGVITKSEIINLLNAFSVLNCEFGDSISIDMLSSLSDSDIDTLLSSYIMATLISGLLIDAYEGPTFTGVVYSSKEEIQLISIENIKTYIKLASI